MQSKQVYLISPAGYPNLGDEWIAFIRLSELLADPLVKKVYLDCQNPEVFATLFPQFRRDARVELVSAAWQWCRELQPLGLWNGLIEAERVLRSGVFNSPASYLWLSRIEDATFKPTHIEVLGGGFINDLWPAHGLLLRIAQHMKRVMGASLHWRNGSIYPCGAALQFDLAAVISDFDTITCRDEASVAQLSLLSPHVRLTQDAVLENLLCSRPVLLGPQQTNDQPHCYVNLARDLSEANDFAVAFTRVVQALRPLSKSHRIVYLLANPVADVVAVDRLLAVFPAMQVWSLHQIIRQSTVSGWDLPHGSTAYANRFHVRMYLARLGVEGKWWSNNPYYDNKQQLLNNLTAGFAQWQML